MLFGVSPPAFAADPDDPAAELASFQVADGFEVNLFASEKDGVLKPIQMRFDARGRLWVIGSTVYPQIEPGQVPNDKVLILEDTDGDGRCDRTTVFADGLMIPTGIELGDGGVYLAQGTELWHLRDTDGDDRADERRVVLRGFGTGDNHQNINSFLFGPGGELWFSQGLHIRSHVETPWGIVRLEQAGLWRFRPRRLQLEGFYGSEHEPQNPWGFVFTDWGEPIVLAGNNSSPIYPVPGLVTPRRDDAPTLIWKNGNGRKTSGGDIVGTRHFPDSWQGTLLLGGYIHNAVWAVRIVDDGAGFRLEDLPPLIRSTHRSFRPVDVKFGPDGALYLCDWYNPVIGHYQASFRDPNRDKTHGRIWRVTARGRPLTRPPSLAGAPIAGLLDHLQSSDRWTRHFAKRALADRPADAVAEALRKWTARPDRSERALVEALGVCQSHERVEPALLARLCRATDPGARAYAAGAVGLWADRLTDPLALLRPLAADENPRVRLQAIIACAHVPRPEAMETLAMAADYPVDPFLDYAFKQAVFALKSYWLPALRAGQLHWDDHPARLGMLVRADGTPDTLEALRVLSASGPAGGAHRDRYLSLLAEVGDPVDLARLLDPQTFTVGGAHDDDSHARVLAAMAEAARTRKTRPAGDAAAALARLWAGARGDTLRLAILHLATQWKSPALEAQALYAAACTPDNDALRIAGAVALAVTRPDTAPTTLADLARPSRVQGERVAAAIGWLHLDPPRAADLAADILSGDSRGESAERILPAFLERQGGAAALGRSLAAKGPTPASAEAGLRVMSAGGRGDPALTQALRRAAGLETRGLEMSPAQIGEFAAEVRQHGNAAAGADIFRRAQLGCATCHAVDGVGGRIGPDLSALGTAQPVEFIIGAILDPQKEVKEGYLSLSIVTRDGEEYQGYRVTESGDELVLRDVLQNREIRLRRDAIRERRESGSVMPSGLADTLTRMEFRDLVRFLSELGKPK